MNTHTYEYDWQPNSITWSIDGQVVRTLNREDTWNETANRYSFPQTPARVQLSLWPAGLPTNAEGTIQWAGGVIDWNSPYMVRPSSGQPYYAAAFDEVDVQCYDPPTGANVSGSVSYIYTNDAGTNNTVAVTNEKTVLKSFLATGLNPSYNPNSAASSSAAQSTQATVPGQNGVGPGSNGFRGGGSASGTSTSSGSSATGFVQGNGGQNNGAPSSVRQWQDPINRGSFFAVALAIVGLLVL